MNNENLIVTKDINEVARIHSNPQYANWRMEFVDGEYRFYSPNYQKQVENSTLTEKEEIIYVTLEELEPLLSESGYMCYGHGTGRMGDSDEVVNSIFSEGLRTKDNSLYYTTIGLSTPTPELKEQFKKLGLPEPSIKNLQNQFNNWQHQDSKKIVIARIPTEYINSTGDRSDRDGEMFDAFYIQKVQPNGQVTNYLDPKFIIGCFDVEKQMVRLNKGYERELKSETIKKLKEGYKKALEKTKQRLASVELNITEQEELQEMIQQAETIQNYDYSSYDSFDFPEIEWDIPSETEHIRK